MLNQGWFRNQNNVVCCRKEEVLPKLARELAIPDLSQRVEEFQKTPTAEGVNISGRKRTTLKLLIPNLTFSEPIDMGEKRVDLYGRTVSGLLPVYAAGGR